MRISRLPVCDVCVGQMHPTTGTLCQICGERVHAAYALPADDGVVRCPVCSRLAPPFARAVAYGSYEGGLRELIHLLKYSGVRPAARVLGRMLAEAIAALDFSEVDATLVIPVPLHKAKRRQRGFNQAELIAQAALKLEPVSGRLSLLADVLDRQRETGSQIGLTAHQRRQNLRGAFAVLRADAVNGRDVLLVDDVLTTGATAAECARVLLRAGARRVQVATVARTLKFASQYAELVPEKTGSMPEGTEVPMAKAVGN